MNTSTTAYDRSCFDTAYPMRDTFWSPVDSPHQQLSLSTQPALYSGSLHIDSIDIEAIHSVALHDGLLSLHRPASGDLLATARLDYQRTDLILVQKAGIAWYALKLRSSASQTLLLSRDLAAVRRWHRHLRPFVVSHDYALLYATAELIGQGAFSKVYRAVHLKSKRVFAAKAIDHSMIFGEDMLDRLVRLEIEIMRLLKHPGIPRLHEVYEQDSQVILVMDYFDGEQFGEINLHDLTREDIAMIAWNLLKIASHLQQNNIVHRDLKPANLMFKRKGSSNRIQVKLIDFGLSVFQH